MLDVEWVRGGLSVVNFDCQLDKISSHQGDKSPGLPVKEFLHGVEVRRLTYCGSRLKTKEKVNEIQYLLLSVP